MSNGEIVEPQSQAYPQQEYVVSPVAVPRKPRRSWGRYFVFLVLVIGVTAGAFYWFGVSPFKRPWQAVFLANNQVYFGHVQPSFGRYLKLADIYYVQISQRLQPAEAGQVQQVQDLQLVKLGGELHGPEDAMYINRSQIVFVEYLKSSSGIVQGIEQLKARSTVKK